jgi:hypothetical protein
MWFVRVFVVGLCGFLVWQVRGREGQTEEEGAGAGGGRSEEDGRKGGRSEGARVAAGTRQRDDATEA